ncbi:MAG: hypothetical protein J7599_07625 [Niabella sp.]|nr:hypothetical protein [Niabella sp.]
MITLRDYQVQNAAKAVELLSKYNIAYLNMQTRTGKTLTSLKAAADFGAKVVLFVTTKKAIKSVEDDNKVSGFVDMLDVINYEQLHKYVAEGNSIYDLVIVDEAHKNGAFPKPSLRATQLKTICKDLPIIYLSGTPTNESYSQVYHQFFVSSFSPFKEYGSFYKWAKDYVFPKKRYLYNREINDYSHSNEQKIKEAVGHLFISFSQEQAGFKQQIKEEVLNIVMDKKTYWLASKLIKDRVFIGKNGEEIIADTEVKLQNKLHQIYSGSVIAEDGTSVIFDISKASFIRDYFKGKKIAIFYKFSAEGEMLRRAFGSSITESPEHFNATDSSVFISQIQSGREGINLSTADALVMFNIDFASLSYWQARDRIQVLDRKKEALMYWVFAKDGIENKVYERVMEKKDYTLNWFRRDFSIKRHPLNEMKNQLNEFMGKYGIDSIQMGSHEIKRDEQPKEIATVNG